MGCRSVPSARLPGPHTHNEDRPSATPYDLRASILLPQVPMLLFLHGLLMAALHTAAGEIATP